MYLSPTQDTLVIMKPMIGNLVLRMIVLCCTQVLTATAMLRDELNMQHYDTYRGETHGCTPIMCIQRLFCVARYKFALSKLHIY